MAQDSSRPEFWDVRYRDGVTPWDAAGVPLRALRWVEKLPSSKILVPGCGTGYEVAAFAERGHEVTGIEFSDAALEAARAFLGARAHLVRKADFFDFDTAPFDLVYERAFLCALPRALWARWAERLSVLVRHGGAVAGFFYFDDNQRGPPFGISPQRLDELLRPAFERVEDEAIPESESIAVFKGKERWQAWGRQL